MSDAAHGHARAERKRDINGFPRRSSVVTRLDHDNPIGQRQRESTPQCGFLLTFGEHRADAERTANLLPMTMPPSAGERIAVGWRCFTRAASALLAERFSEFRILQHERALQIPFAVQARREAEVPLESAPDLRNKSRTASACIYVAFPLRGVRRLSSNSFRIRLYSSAQLAFSVNP